MELIKKFQTLIATVVFVAAAAALVIKYQELPGVVQKLRIDVIELEKKHNKDVSELESKIDILETKITLNEKRIDQEVLNTGVEDIFKN